ncbi:S-adenosyl-L-methionine-dependent methyltransferase [Wilcoxina mikolae CBS 423.85]|nr:S-adenosyl-L-methionine-dependent methyltransferase [Wilcoxina mikolae CBS 423.85]
MATTTETSYSAIERTYTYRATHLASPTLRTRLTTALGYDPCDLSSIPDSANIGESCGNPLLIAHLKEGETVIDLGCGGGMDVLLAAKKVGDTGKVVGVDMTEKMISLATSNAAAAGVKNVEFYHTRISTLPLEDNTVDCVLSNCVFNLVPDEEKEGVVKEVYRVLKPGGRLAWSDFLALKEMPGEMKGDERLVAGCVAGATERGVLEGWLKEAGFEDVLVVDGGKGLPMGNTTTPCCAGEGCGGEEGRTEVGFDLGEWIGSFQIFALKPAADSTDSTVVSTTTPEKDAATAEQGKKACCCKGGGC